MKLDAKVLYLIAGAMVIVGGKVVILSHVWFPQGVMNTSDMWSAFGETVFALGIFALVAALVYKVFIEKHDI